VLLEHVPTAILTVTASAGDSGEAISTAGIVAIAAGGVLVVGLVVFLVVRRRSAGERE
jgi:hypothetical protein